MTDDSLATPQVKLTLTNRDAEILRFIIRNGEHGSLEGEIMLGLALSRAEERARCAAIARSFLENASACIELIEAIERDES